mmetsp:Transcript_48892/g.87922  ORF Transcript_48892/g.87922 Transcript_48892/m.87922 type:complete len:203 (+) Transcript_48892:898-1506(+)
MLKTALSGAPLMGRASQTRTLTATELSRIPDFQRAFLLMASSLSVGSLGLGWEREKAAASHRSRHLGSLAALVVTSHRSEEEEEEVIFLVFRRTRRPPAPAVSAGSGHAPLAGNPLPPSSTWMTRMRSQSCSLALGRRPRCEPRKCRQTITRGLEEIYQGVPGALRGRCLVFPPCLLARTGSFMMRASRGRSSPGPERSRDI